MKKIISSLMLILLSSLMFSQTETQYTTSSLVQSMISEIDGVLDNIQDFEGYRIIYVDVPKKYNDVDVKSKLNSYTCNFLDVNLLTDSIKIKKSYFLIYVIQNIMDEDFEVLTIEYNVKTDKIIFTYKYNLDYILINAEW